MKKTDKKKLTLTKITVMPLDGLSRAAGGRPRMTENMSVCFEQCCYTDYCGGSTGC